MFRRHWVWQLLVLSADEYGGCHVQCLHDCSHGYCGSLHLVNFGQESCEFSLEVRVATAAKNEYFEQQPVQCQLQMTKKISLKKTQYQSL